VPQGSYRRIDFNKHCAEIVAQTSLLIGHLNGADVTVPVPTCPGWNVSQLARHVDGGQRWVREIVTTRASEPPSDVALRGLFGATDEDPETLSASLTAATAEARGSVTDLLLTIYRRLPVSGLDVTGDAKLVDLRLERVAFG